MRSNTAMRVMGALFVAQATGIGWIRDAQALPILYDQTETESVTAGVFKAVPTSRPGTDISEMIQIPEQNNCIANEGCLGNLGFAVVFIKPDGSTQTLDTGNLPESIHFSFPMTGELKAEIKRTGAIGTLTVVASRDIGNRQRDKRAGDVGDGPFFEDLAFFIRTNVDPPDRFLEFLSATANGVRVGDLFKDFNSPLACAPGEDIIDDVRNMIAIVKDETCGPNYHTDVKATASTLIAPEATAQILALEEPGDVDIALSPEGPVGRLKIFSVNLRYVVTPEPASWLLLGSGLVALAFARRKLSV